MARTNRQRNSEAENKRIEKEIEAARGRLSSHIAPVAP